jgi:hypothetical protein
MPRELNTFGAFDRVTKRCPGPGSPDTWVENVMMPNRARFGAIWLGSGRCAAI